MIERLRNVPRSRAIGRRSRTAVRVSARCRMSRPIKGRRSQSWLALMNWMVRVFESYLMWLL